MSHAQTWFGPVATNSRGRRCFRGREPVAVPEEAPAAAARDSTDDSDATKIDMSASFGHELMRRQPDELRGRSELDNLDSSRRSARWPDAS